MRLARLELFGFKSFPDRTTFHFGPGISCVVGPNGSGKSNVVDALKWCVGEQSARSLRGAEMSDVIFAGSVDRKPVGFAEVVLTLVTDDSQPFPGDYAAMHEVAVGRRLHRTGTSEYTINQTRVRRRDVIELLLDSGVGNDLYSFIEQGQVDKMISASPEDRRSLIDEAAGISRYKARRDEARERLEATAAQLDRAADVVDEMARQLRTLEGQVYKTAEFRRLGALIRLGELRLALAKHLSLSLELGEVQQQSNKVREQEQAARADVVRREVEVEQRRVELELAESGLLDLRERISDLDGAIREANASAHLHERRRAELVTEQERSVGEARRQREAVTAAQAEVDEASREQASIEARLAELDAELEAGSRAVIEADQALAVARKAQREADQGVQVALQERVKAEGALAAANQAASERELRIAALEADLAERQLELVQARQKREKADASSGQSEQELEKAQLAVIAADTELAALREAEGQARAAAAAAEEERDRELALREGARKERAAAVERGRRWLRAVEQASAEEVSRTSESWGKRLTEIEESGRARLAAARQQADALRRKDLGELQQQALERRERLDKQLAESRAAVTSTKSAAKEAETRHLALVRQVATLEAEHAGLRRQLASAGGANKLLQSVLPSVQTLLELAPPAEQTDWVRKLGDRARWVVVRDRESLLKLARARPAETSVSVVYWPHGAPSPAEGVVRVEALSQALEQDMLHQGAVAGEGFRVEPGGFVTLGPPGELERALKAEQELLSRVVSAREAVATAEQQRVAAQAALTEAERVAGELALERDEVVRKDATAVEKAHAAAAERGIAAEKEVRSALDAELSELREARERQLASLRGSSREQVELARATLARFEATLDHEEAPLADGVPAARQALRKATDATEAARQRREKAVDARVGREKAKHVALAAVSSAEAEIERLQKQVAQLQAEVAQLVAQRTHQSVLPPLVAAVEAASAREREAKASAEATRGAVTSAEKAERKARDGASKLQVERAKAAERRQSTLSRQAAAKQRGQEAVGAAERSEAHAAELAAQATSAAQARQEALDEAGQATEERGDLWDQLEESKQRAGRLAAARDEAEKGLRKARAQVDQLAAQIEKVSGQQGALTQELEVLSGRMDDRYQASLPALVARLQAEGRVILSVDEEVQKGLTLAGYTVAPVAPVVLGMPELESDKLLRAASADLDAYRQAHAALGEVNLAAPGEYRELLTRHDELAAQRLDLEQSVEGIRAAIAKLNKLCRERFRETFDRVNDYFQEVYPRLVGGGSARLSLTNEEDLLETGVEIFVQPPGKRLQNLQLLSGGEKAMTAIALLISLFRVKPSPFCVLDEVDAPLDEANGARFNEMLKEMSARSQFLVITHNRKTMECADTLYGITMARPGVSRLVSVDLEAW
jgi:chromosome segregation protein